MQDDFSLESEITKTNSEFTFPYFLVGIALGAIAALLLAPSPGEETWTYVRAQSNKGLDYLNQQAAKLRERTEAVIKKGSKLIGSHRDPVDTTTKAEKQAYQEEKRKTLGDRYHTLADGTWNFSIPAFAAISL